MAISLEGLGGPAPLAGRQDRQHAQAREGRWLQELEQALLSQGAKKHAAPREQQDDGCQIGGRRLGGRQVGDRQVGGRQVDDDAAVPARGVRQPESNIEASEPAAVSQGAAVAASARPGAAAGGFGDERAAPVGAAVKPADPRPDDAAVNTDAPLRPAGMSATLAPVFAAPSGASALLPLPVSGAYATAGTAAGLAGVGAGAELHVGVVELSAPTSPPKPLVTAMTALAAPGGGEAAAQSQSAAEPDETAAPGQGASRTPADGEDYASRLLHVYRDADGVQAWIRDASLDAAVLPGLAEAMVEQLGDAGARLAMLTVNGRKLALPDAARRDAADSQDGYSVDTAQPAQPGGEPARPPINPNGAV
ncbi:hypothetical protein CSQ96_20830 [Janthinobacterium sp. BJB412]|nr:hypothetical protein CSQ96_20830 [Janthinobacterium sp. BJB412]